MEQPLRKPVQSPSLSPPKPNNGNVAGTGNGNGVQKRKLPTPKELIAHYESQGMNPQEASLKVIGDLQNALFRVVTSPERKGGGGGAKNEDRKLDVINARILSLDAKIDSKPGYAPTFAIGVVSGAALRGIGAVFPQVAGAVGQIWNAVRSTTNTTDK